MQIGESAVIAAMTGLPVVADFRPMDLALGGEGAPLAPLAHLWLFGDRKTQPRHPEHRRHRQRHVPEARRERSNDPTLIAFDTGPGGMLIDALVNEVFERFLEDGSRRQHRRTRARERSATRGLDAPSLLSPPPAEVHRA